MILFFIKKNFFDGWDNAFWIIASNILVMAVAAACYFGASGILDLAFLPQWLAVGISVSLLILGIFGVVSLVMSINECCAKIANFSTVSVKDIFANYKAGIKDSILLSLLLGAVCLVAVVGIPFYYNMGNSVGSLFSALLFWVVLVVILALQWFLPLRSQMQGNFKKTLKKCFIIFFDNTGFSIFMFIYNLILAVLSCFVFLFPGFAGISLALNNALRLRLYKYDWLEQHPDISVKDARKQIPWGELIAEDAEIVGQRTLKSMFFPWK